MFKNHFKLALRKLKKEKLYSFVNIFGLTIGLTAFLLISLYVRDELSFDKFHTNKDNIYRLVSEHERLGIRSAIASDFVEYFSHDMPQVDSYTRLLGVDEKVLVGHDEEHFNVPGVFFADPNFFDFFSFELKKGSPETVFVNGGEAVISESLSQKLFVFEKALDYVKYSEFENIDTDEVKDLLKSYVERLTGEVKSQTPEYNKPLVGTIRDTLKELMQKELEQLPETLKDLEPVQRLNVLCKLIPYVLPKVEAVHSEKGEPEIENKTTFSGYQW